jgi:flagellar biosynthesis chaperone FliJ
VTEEKTMRGLNGKKSFWRSLRSLALAVVLLSSVLFVGAGPTFAAGESEPSPQEGTTERGIPRLEFAYLRLQHAAEGQALHLEHAGEVADFVGDWSETLAEQGQDVSQLQAALDSFRARLAEAQGHYEEAKAVLDVHAGFDEDGVVVDREQARETLREAGRSLGDARRALKDAATQLRRAIRDWGREHRPRTAES